MYITSRTYYVLLYILYGICYIYYILHILYTIYTLIYYLRNGIDINLQLY